MIAVQEKFDKFVEFYRANRDRFKLCDRKRWDELTSRLDTPKDFWWTSEREFDHDYINLGYKERNGEWRYAFPLYQVMYHKWTGRLVLKALADLGTSIDGLNPELADAISVLIEFKEDLEDLVLWYDIDVDGKLIRLKLIRCKGLMQVLASNEEE
jgi:hypothetical protein